MSVSSPSPITASARDIRNQLNADSIWPSLVADDDDGRYSISLMSGDDPVEVDPEKYNVVLSLIEDSTAVWRVVAWPNQSCNVDPIIWRADDGEGQWECGR